MTNPNHSENLIALKRIEGQVRGIQKMIEENKYCIDILTQLRSANRAIASVQEKIYKTHLEACVKGTLQGKSEQEKQKKIDEVIDLFKKHRGGF